MHGPSQSPIAATQVSALGLIRRPWRARLVGFFGAGLTVLALLVSPIARADTVRVAVASNFAKPARDLAKAFAAQSGHTAQIALGSTGQLYAQIQNGAPFDVFLAADSRRPGLLVANGAALASSRFTYATGQLALWSADSTLVDAQGEVLRHPPRNATRLAMANPKQAPYGVAAQQVLQHLGLAALWQAHTVMGENIAQTHQFVTSGNAQLGFVALSQVSSQGRFTAGSGWIVPGHTHDPITQDAVLLTRAAQQPAALAWMAFLNSDAAATIIRAAGYLR